MRTLDVAALLGWPFRDVHVAYAQERTMLHALCIGLGGDPCDERQLRYVYEPRLKAFPTLALTLGLTDDAGFLHDERVGIDFSRMLHGQTGLRWHKPLAAVGEVTSRFAIEGLSDRGVLKGSLLRFSRTLRDRATGDLLVTETGVYMLRGNGGFSSGLDAGEPSMAPVPIPAGPRSQCMELDTLPQSALLYRLAAGDRTGLHASPALARQSGFERPVLQGGCSFGVTAHGLVAMLCDYEGDRLRAMDARFTAPVFPGERLRVEVWRQGPRSAAFRTTSLPRGVVVLDNGTCEFEAP
ncbi:MaoC/PaaZ C-terminal domain-containing protein (plasmid) [Variovorax sp. V59]|uniref:MaoC/PaaZ C-terminal domain-containing protein n=1 Tax=unclassified Variovorax TaxID=663243 RepID=UPI0034E8F84A